MWRIPGVVLEEEEDRERDIRVTTVRIETEKGAKIMGKPVGNIHHAWRAPNWPCRTRGTTARCRRRSCATLRRLLPADKDEFSVLVAGLGNRQVTPDALGPYVADNLNITRHIVKEYGKYAMGRERVCSSVPLYPASWPQTGMETVEILRGVVREAKPDAVVAIDALAARNTRRLNRTVQISDTGINPGRGSATRGTPSRRRRWGCRSSPSACPRWWMRPLLWAMRWRI